MVFDHDWCAKRFWVREFYLTTKRNQAQRTAIQPSCRLGLGGVRSHRQETATRLEFKPAVLDDTFSSDSAGWGFKARSRCWLAPSATVPPNLMWFGKSFKLRGVWSNYFRVIDWWSTTLHCDLNLQKCGSLSEFMTFGWITICTFSRNLPVITTADPM